MNKFFWYGFGTAVAVGAVGAGSIWSVEARAQLASTSNATAPAAAGNQRPLSYGAAINLEQAKQVIAAAEAEMKRRNVVSTVVIVDPDGELVYAEKAMNAKNAAIDIAWAKARSSARYGNTTRSFHDTLMKGDLANSLGLPGAAVMGAGGVPIIYQNQIIGAIGATGSRADNDEAVAQTGADVLK
jgi:glc operon protein GlcG